MQGTQEVMEVQGAQEAKAGATSSGGQGRCKELRRPWQVQGAQEAMVVQGAQEAMAVQGAQEAMAVQGAQEAMAVQGAQEAMVVQGAQEAMAGGLSWPWPRPGHSSRNPSTPQKKFPWGS